MVREGASPGPTLSQAACPLPALSRKREREVNALVHCLARLRRRQPGEAVRRLPGEAAVGIAGQVGLRATRAPRRDGRARSRAARPRRARSPPAACAGSRGTTTRVARRPRPRSVLRSDTTPRRSRAPRRPRRGPARTEARRSRRASPALPRASAAPRPTERIAEPSSAGWRGAATIAGGIAGGWRRLAGRGRRRRDLRVRLRASSTNARASR